MNMAASSDDDLVSHDQADNLFFLWLSRDFPKLLLLDKMPVHRDVVMELDRLIELAGLQLPESNIAREALGYFVTTYGGAQDGEKAYLAAVAAQALIRLSYDRDLREQMFPLIESALCESVALAADLRLMLLDALDAFAQDRHWRDDHVKELGDVVFRALRTEFQRRSGERDERYQTRLLFLLRTLGGPDAVPFLDAIEDAHENPEIRELAKQTSRYVMYSLERIWNATREDQVSMPPNRARRLLEAPDLGLNTSEMVQAIFQEMRGLPVVSSDDPRAAALAEYMHSESVPRIQLAAAFALAMSLQVEEPFVEALTAIDVLTNFAVNCDSPSDINDAMIAIKRVSERAPCMVPAITSSKQRASEEFIRRSTLDFSV